MRCMCIYIYMERERERQRDVSAGIQSLAEHLKVRAMHMANAPGAPTAAPFSPGSPDPGVGQLCNFDKLHLEAFIIRGRSREGFLVAPFQSCQTTS